MMKNTLLFVCLSVLVSACSTSAIIKVPADAKLYFGDRPGPVVVADKGEVTTRPFFWTAIAGIPFRLEQNDKVVKQGKLRAKFRPASIFWPPYGAIYWPVGFAYAEYDLTGSTPESGVPATAKPVADAAITQPN